jgi:hypothetical protein
MFPSAVSAAVTAVRSIIHVPSREKYNTVAVKQVSMQSLDISEVWQRQPPCSPPTAARRWDVERAVNNRLASQRLAEPNKPAKHCEVFNVRQKLPSFEKYEIAEHGYRQKNRSFHKDIKRYSVHGGSPFLFLFLRNRHRSTPEILCLDNNWRVTTKKVSTSSTTDRRWPEAVLNA